MAPRSTFELLIAGDSEAAEANGYNDGITTNNSIKKVLPAGTATDEMNVLYKDDSADSGALVASGTLSLDLQTALDGYGDALALSDTALVYIEHKLGSASSSVHVKANGSNGWTNALGTAANLVLKPGDFVILGSFVASNKAVSGSNKVIDIANQDAQTADYVIEVWGRR